MNKDYTIERWLVTLLMIVLALILIFFANQIVTKTKYTGKAKLFLTVIVASIFSLLFFYPCAIIDNFYDIGNKYITGMALVFIPLSILTLIVFTTLFLFRRIK